MAEPYVRTNADIRFRTAQSRGLLVATGRDREGWHYAVTTRYRRKRRLASGTTVVEEGEGDDDEDAGETVEYIPASRDYFLWEIQTLGDRVVRPDDLLREVGSIDFTLDDDYKDAEIGNSGIDPDFRHKGLGLLLYKTAVNDLLERGYRSRSDTLRSEAAERVWRSIRRDNPDRVAAVGPDRVGGGPAYYLVGGFVGRRPQIRVGRYKRRLP